VSAAVPAPRVGDSQAGAAVELAGVGKTFRGRTDVTALDDVDLTIGIGEFVTFIGPSGCGKSTLLRLIADLTEPSSGTVSVNGKTARQARLDQDYGIAFQLAGLMEWRTVARNVELPLELRGWDRARRRTRARELLELVGLPDFADSWPVELSGGMQQRVAIARAIAFDPQVLLMDEPFAAVDAQTRADLEDLIRDIWKRTGVTILFVTHDIDESVYLGERVLILSGSPTVVQEDLPIDLPEDRDQLTTRSMPRFAELRGHVYEQIQRAKKESAPADAG
jgi:NitT/TauT family transport system ATP-binding protein